MFAVTPSHVRNGALGPLNVLAPPVPVETCFPFAWCTVTEAPLKKGISGSGSHTIVTETERRSLYHAHPPHRLDMTDPSCDGVPFAGLDDAGGDAQNSMDGPISATRIQPQTGQPHPFDGTTCPCGSTPISLQLVSPRSVAVSL